MSNNNNQKLENRIKELETELENQKKAQELNCLKAHVLDQISDRVVLTDLEGIVTYINKKEVKKLGFKKEELIGKNVEIFGNNPKKGATQQQILEETLKKGKWQGEIINHSKSGEEVILYCKAKLIYDENNNPIAVSGISTDITKKKEIEKILRKKEERFRGLLENLPISIYMHDNKTGEIIYANSYALKEYDCKDLKELELKGLFNAQGYTREKALEKILLIQEKGPQKFEWYNEKKDGTGIWKEIRLQEINVDETQRILSVAYDITDRKNFEKLVVSTERLNAIKDLSNGVSHDFNNALQIISSNLEIALMNESISSDIRDYLQTAIESAQNVKNRIQILQKFSDERYQKPKTKLFNLKDVIEDTISQTERLCKDVTEKNGMNIKINKYYEENIPIFGNKSELNIALYDLFQNSIETMSQGGEITITSKKKEDFVYLTLNDTGEGMDEETQKKIFQPFFSTKSLKQGSGLGMTGAYSIIKNHKGEIYIKESIIGKGTTFEIKLPLSKPQNNNNNNNNSQNYTGNLRILWVDDEDMIRDLGQKMMSSLGYSVDVAYDGENALNLLENNEYDLLITDIGMPKMDGWQLTENIKEKYLPMKRAVLSGWSLELDDETKEKYNIQYILNKPVQLKELKDLMSYITTEK